MIAIWNETETLTLNESVEESDYGDIVPRVSRTATLDGGAVITNSGCSHADRTLVIVADNAPVATETAIKRMTSQALTVWLSNSEGVFAGVISQLSCKSGRVSFTYLVTEKLTMD